MNTQMMIVSLQKKLKEEGGNVLQFLLSNVLYLRCKEFKNV